MNTFTINKPNGSLTIAAEPFDSEASIPRIYLSVGGECHEGTQDCAEEICNALNAAAQAARDHQLTFAFEDEGVTEAPLGISVARCVVTVAVGESSIALTATQAAALAEAYASLTGWAGKDVFYRTCGLTGLAEQPSGDFPNTF